MAELFSNYMNKEKFQTNEKCPLCALQRQEEERDLKPEM